MATMEGANDGTGDVLETALAWHGEGRRIALATVIATWGSSPWPAGSQLVADEDGRFEGSVSGGCVEAEVIRAAREVVQGGPPRLLEFGVSDEQAWEAGLACGGRIHVYVEALTDAGVPAAILAARASRRPVALVTSLDDARKHLVYPDEVVFQADFDQAARDQEFDEAVRAALAAERSGVMERGERRYFVQTFAPAPRLIIVGAVHVAQALAPMARLAGFTVHLVDPRRAFATSERFPGVDLRCEWPAEALESIGLDPRTALVTLSHDPKIDEPALAAALRAGIFYVGALGSRRTQAARVERLRQRGLEEALIARIRAPVGLPLGGRAPAEVAVAILAEIIGERYRTAVQVDFANPVTGH